MDEAAPNCLKRSYSVQYLKSFAQSCRGSPPNIDLQEVNTELADELIHGEWRKHSPNSVSQGKHTRHRRNRKKKHTGLQDSENGISTFPAWRAAGFDTVNQQDPKTTDKAFPIETSTVSKVEVCNRTSIDKNRLLSLTPLKLSETDIEESQLTCSKDADEASSSDEFQKEFFGHFKPSDTGGGDSSPGSTLSTFSPEQKIDIDSLFVKDKHRALPMPAARTVQDIEKDLLSDKETSEVEANTSPSPDSKTRVQWGDNNEDKAASEHILSVLQQKNKGKKPGGVSEKELLGELISSSPISNKLANLDDVLKRYELIAAADFQQAVSESKLGVENKSLNNTWNSSGMGSCSPTVVVDSVRTSVNAVQNQKVKSLPKPCSTSKNYNQQQQQQMWPRNSWAPNVFVRSGVAGVGAPLVPQALHALQRLVDHQLHILNSIPGEVTPGMLHERLSRSVLGYPPTGTHLLFTTHLR